MSDNSPEAVERRSRLVAAVAELGEEHGAEELLFAVRVALDDAGYPRCAAGIEALMAEEREELQR